MAGPLKKTFFCGFSQWLGKNYKRFKLNFLHVISHLNPLRTTHFFGTVRTRGGGLDKGAKFYLFQECQNQNLHF